MSIETKLKELNIVLENIPERKMLEPVTQVGNLIYTSGQVCMSYKNKTLVAEGKLGEDVSVEQGQKASRQCIINCVSALHDHIGNLNKVKRVVKVNGYIQCSDDFVNQRDIMDAASQLLHDIFGEKGKHSRTSVGVYKLPLNASVEVEMVVEVE